MTVLSVEFHPSNKMLALPILLLLMMIGASTGRKAILPIYTPSTGATLDSAERLWTIFNIFVLSLYKEFHNEVIMP